MSHLTGMSLPHKHNVLKTSINQGKCKAKSCPTTAAEARCNAVTYSEVRRLSQKVKRLKSKKERNQIRGLERNGSHACPQHSRNVSNEKSQHHDYHQSHSVVSSRKEKAFAKTFVSQKPSIITEGRLTSIRGLFSHEVRSLDIERLVSDQLKNEKQRKSMMHVISPLPPYPPDPVPESDQDCALDEVQEPQQESENNASSYVRTRKSSEKGNAFQTNKEVTVHMESSTQDGKKRKKEDTNNKSRPGSSNSLNGSYELWSSSANKLPHLLCSTPVEAIKIYSDFPEIDSPISPHENNKGNIEVPPNKSDPSVSELDSGTGTLAGNGSEREQISVSVREAVKKLAARVWQTLEHNGPKRSLLTECRELLLKTLQKTHSFHLQDNLRKLHSLRNGKQTDSFGSGQTFEDCSYVNFSHGVGNEDSKHRRNMEIWKDNFTLREEVKRDSYRDASMKKHRVQAERILSSPVSQPLQQSHTEMFDQFSKARLSQDCFRTQHYPSTMLFQQDQYASPISSAPTWTSHLYEPGFQQLFGDSQRKCESITNVGFDLISDQWKENTDPLFNSYYKYQNTEEKAQETFLGRTSFWSDQLHVQDVREQWAPTSFSASFPSEGFRFKPYFRFPHPSNSQHGSDWLDMTLHPRSNTDSALYHHWG